MMRIAQEDIAKKKQLDKDLKEKYPEIKLDPDMIVKCDTDEV